MDKKQFSLDVSSTNDANVTRSPKSSPRLFKSISSLFKSKSTDDSVRELIDSILSGTVSTDEMSPRSQDILEEKTAIGKTGWLYKRGEDVKSWKRRYFILHGIYFLYFASDKNISKEKGTICIQGISVQNYPPFEAFESQKYILQLHAKDRLYFLSTESLEDYFHWGNLLRKNALYFNKKTLKVSKHDNEAYPTIEEALFDANEFDRILVDEGEYNESIFIKTPVWIDSEKNAVISSLSGATITCNFTGSCRISRLKIKSESTTPCIYLKNGCLTILKCEISKHDSFLKTTASKSIGVKVMNESQLTITKSTFTSNEISAIEASNKSFLQSNDSHFIENPLNSITLLNASTANLINTSFKRNGGDAVKISTSSCVAMEDCSFEENSTCIHIVQHEELKLNIKENQFNSSSQAAFLITGEENDEEAMDRLKDKNFFSKNATDLKYIPL